MKKIVLQILMLLLILTITLLGNSSSELVNSEVGVETVEVSLDSFSTLGIFIMIGLSSLLGAFFLKD